MHKMLLRALDGEALLLGICASLNPEAVVARMEEGIDLDAHPQWAAECDAHHRNTGNVPTWQAHLLAVHSPGQQGMEEPGGRGLVRCTHNIDRLSRTPANLT